MAQSGQRLPQHPPPTAHRLAAWLSLARGLTQIPANRIRFPPTDDDVQTLIELWRQRVGELKNAGVRALQNRQVYEVALACAPHAFAYAGSGKVCRLAICPFCHAADAAAAYERVRRAIERGGKNIGFLLGQRSRWLRLDDLQAGMPRLLDPAAGEQGLRVLEVQADVLEAAVQGVAQGLDVTVGVGPALQGGVAHHQLPLAPPHCRTMVATSMPNSCSS